MVTKDDFAGQIDVCMALEYAQSERKGILLLRYLFQFGLKYSPENFRALRSALEDLIRETTGMFRNR